MVWSNRLLQFVSGALDMRVTNVKKKWGVDPWVDLRRIVKAEHVQCVFDVGANTGQTARVLNRLFPKAEIYSFEPVAETFKKLVENTSSMTRVNAVKLALADATGTSTIHTYSDSRIASLATDTPYLASLEVARTSVAEQVDVSTVSDVAARWNLDKIDILKIDTEGFDSEVIRGAEKLLKNRAIHFVYTEFNHVKWGSECRGSLLLAAELLYDHGFELISTYTDRVEPHRQYFGVHNALFGLARNHV